MKFSVQSVVLICSLLSTFAACTSSQNDDPFVQLQKDIFSGKIQRDVAVQHTLELFRAIDVPDSLHQDLRQRVQTLAGRIAGASDHRSSGHPRNESPFESAENRLTALLRKTVASIALQDTAHALNLIEQAKQTIASHPSTKARTYWQETFSAFSAGDSLLAHHWLATFSAQRLIRRHARSPIGRQYAALGLQHYEHVRDPRLQAMLYQRIQTLLYKLYNLNELANNLGHLALEIAREADDQLRINSVQYDLATSLQYTGQVAEAVALFSETQSRAARYPNLTSMRFFFGTGRLALLAALIDAGDYQQATALLQKLDYSHLSVREKINFHNSAARLYRSEGDYPQAVKAYSTGLKLAKNADDVSNTFAILHNLGALYQSLREYDKARAYYSQADSLLQLRASRDHQKQVTLATSLLEFYSTINDQKAFNKIVARTQELVDRIDAPLERAMVQRSLGQFYLKSKRFQQAISYLTEALEALDAGGMARCKLPVQLDLARALTQTGELNQALSLTEQARNLAQLLPDTERYIDALGLAAEIHAQLGNIRTANDLSDILIQESATLGNRISSSHLRTLYREKIYPYLKQAVLYEVAAGAEKKAREKLRFAKSGFWDGAIMLAGKSSSAADNDVVERKPAPGHLVIDYLLAADTLYAFYADRAGTGILRREIDRALLQQQISTFQQLLAHPPAAAGSQDAASGELMQTGYAIYRSIFPWPELEARLLKARKTFILPDESLHDLAFAALPIDSAATPRFLVHNTAVSVISTYDPHQAAEPVIRNARILVSADYDFRGAREFVRELKKLYPEVTELRIPAEGDAREHLRRQLSQNHTVYIFLNHGQADRHFPENSFIDVACLVGDSGRQKKVRLRADALEEMNWENADLVYLIGCETAGGKTYQASGIFGLQKLFLLRGARTVIGNLWQVDAAQAIPQARALLDRLASGERLIDGLRTVQLEAIEELQENPYFGFPHPYFWGSQVLALGGGR